MTESEWLTADDLGPRLHDKANRALLPLSERKLRLLACAFCRLYGDAALTARDRRRIEIAEAFADGEATRGQLLAGRSMNPGMERNTLQAFLWEITYPSEGHPVHGEHTVPARERLERFLRGWLGPVKTALLRDIFGNPFRPVAFDPAWRTDTAVSLARQMYEAREFSAMPILADALQDAGCNSDEVLSHCRDAKLTHVRGCWVVDLVLDKEPGASRAQPPEAQP